MSDKVSSKAEIPYPLTFDDIIYIIRDVSGTLTPFKGVLGDLFRSYVKFVPGFEGYIILPADGNVDSTIIEQDDILVGKGAYFYGKYVMMRALQDNPTLDAHFDAGISKRSEVHEIVPTGTDFFLSETEWQKGFFYYDGVIDFSLIEFSDPRPATAQYSEITVVNMSLNKISFTGATGPIISKPNGKEYFMTGTGVIKITRIALPTETIYTITGDLDLEP